MNEIHIKYITKKYVLLIKQKRSNVKNLGKKKYNIIYITFLNLITNFFFHITM